MGDLLRLEELGSGSHIRDRSFLESAMTGQDDKLDVRNLISSVTEHNGGIGFLRLATRVLARMLPLLNGNITQADDHSVLQDML